MEVNYNNGDEEDTPSISIEELTIGEAVWLRSILKGEEEYNEDFKDELAAKLKRTQVDGVIG